MNSKIIFIGLLIWIFSVNSVLGQTKVTPKNAMNLRDGLPPSVYDLPIEAGDQRTVKVSVGEVCGKGKGDKELFNAVKENLMNTFSRIPKENKTLTNASNLYTSGEISDAEFRNGNAIFALMKELIENAEREVLIQTCIFEKSSPSWQLIREGIYALNARLKSEWIAANGGKAPYGDKVVCHREPVHLRFIFDVIGRNEKINLYNLMDVFRFGGAPDENSMRVNIEPEKFFRPCFKMEIRTHSHVGLNVTHSKTLVVDREVAVVTGANMVTYHHTDEINTGKNELMVDHGFLLRRDDDFKIDRNIGLALADDFYTLWNKNQPQAFTRTFAHSDFLENDKNAEQLTKLFDPKHGHYNEYFDNHSFSNLKNLAFNTSERISRAKNASFHKAEFLIAGKESSVKKDALAELNLQDAAFDTLMKRAKVSINATSPSLNSLDFVNELADAAIGGVTVRFINSKNYQDYNGPFQELGTNEHAINYLYQRWEKNKTKDSGNLLVTYFVTRGGAISGKFKGEPFKRHTIVGEKFYNHNHTKYADFDNEVLLLGSANWDTQSYFNSRELSLAIFSPGAIKNICEKTFYEDYVRSQPVQVKRDNGEYCMLSKHCASNKCYLNMVGTERLVKRCVPNGNGVAGEFCYKDNDCVSKKCQLVKEDPSFNKCL